MNKEELLAAFSRPLRRMDVEIEGRTYRLREMTEDDSASYEVMLQDKKGKIDVSKARRAMIAMCLVDDSGSRLIEDESELRKMPRSLASALYAKCLDLNNYEDGEVKALVKNCEEAAG